MLTNQINTFCVCGAGTMGSGIAQLAAMNGFKTILFDIQETVLNKAQVAINSNLQQLFDKNKITLIQKQKTLEHLKFTNNIESCVAEFIIEAIVEKVEVKSTLFRQLESINSHNTIFASNTSSLSISEIQDTLSQPQRFAGMHFFNPATIMKLVEVVYGKKTSDSTIASIVSLCKTLGKTAVVCNDSPGFIVNRVARHYYLEALKILEQEVTSIETIDEILQATGFKMGPFRLMDLIGNDINLTVTESLYESFNKSIRFAPSSIQQQKVHNGELGRKTSKGYYEY